MNERTVLEQFQDAFPETGGWTWIRQIMHGRGRFSSCSKLRYETRATIYFRDEEGGNTARIAGLAGNFPPQLQEFLEQHNLRGESENRRRYGDYLIGPEHARRVVNILLEAVPR